VAKRVGNDGRVIVSDINASMLAVGRDRLIDAGIVGNVEYVIADAEHLPMQERSFDCVTIGFGLRNVTDKEAALREFYRVLRPGGRLVVLEFSKPQMAAVEPIYDAYSFQVLPRLGQLFANDADSYRYLAESIRRHPDQDTLLGMCEAVGFERCEYFNLTMGVVAVHVGFRF
jgi:demethylmenaquinone methyltransferase/2-methoxy-6-polyprenyl-1,4-benzoquinol methylase